MAGPGSRPSRLRPAADRLPVFPWDTMRGAKETASAHPDGLVDLTVGSPVDPVAPVIREALSAASGLSGYPTTAGTPALREAVVAALERRYGVTGLRAEGVLPTIGTKEVVAGLPAQLGVAAGDTVVIPEVAYPTYEVGALIAGATVVRADSVTQLGPSSPALLFLNSPSNPSGKVLGVPHLRKVVEWARERGVVVASDECYLGLGWQDEQSDAVSPESVPPPSILDPRVCDGDHTGLLALHSLSKTSNLAGYRAGFVAGDETLIADLLAYRRHTGLIVPGPVQAATVAALDDDAHEAEQKERYRARRERLWPAVEAAGLRIEHSEAGLYLWATRDEEGRRTVDRLAELGILVAPGEFYGPTGTRHVRIALTATDAMIDEAVRRLG